MVSNSDPRPLHNVTFCPISASGSKFNSRNIQYIPVVEIFAFLELEQKLPFFKGFDPLPKREERLFLNITSRGFTVQIT